LKLLYIVLVSVLIVGCVQKSDVKPEVEVEQINDLALIPQDIKTYTSNTTFTQLGNQKLYEKEYFRVWNNRSTYTLSDAMWAHRAYKAGNTYGENLQLLNSSFFSQMLEESNFKTFQTVNQSAVSLNNLNIRAFPTNRVVLLDPAKAGEGFPFDYLQNSTIAPNKPLFISHYSQNGEWVFVECSFTYGWVKRSEIAIIEDKYTDLWQKAQQVFITKDGESIYSQDNEFLFKSQVGMMLALISEDSTNYTVLSVSNYRNSKPLYLKSKISKSIANKGTLAFNAKNINTIINQISKTNYGWGGMYNQRDCSSTLRDFYAPFGLWLPRNSYQQSRVGERVMVEDLNDTQKIEFIKTHAIPFRTLIYKKGHIALYVGTVDNEIIIYQNVWGVKTKKENIEGRFIIGKPVFSTLEVGSNLKEFDKNSSMLKKLKSISTL